MWTSRSKAPALALFLLLSSTAGSLLHAHSTLVTATDAECSIDHEASNPGGGPSPEVHSGGEEHRHHGPGCQLTRHRFLFGSFADGDVQLLTAARDTPKPVTTPRHATPKTSQPRRGPPAA